MNDYHNIIHDVDHGLYNIHTHTGLLRCDKDFAEE